MLGASLHILCVLVHVIKVDIIILIFTDKKAEMQRHKSHLLKILRLISGRFETKLLAPEPKLCFISFPLGYQCVRLKNYRVHPKKGVFP